MVDTGKAGGVCADYALADVDGWAPRHGGFRDHLQRLEEGQLLRCANGIPCLLSGSTTRRIAAPELRERVSVVIIGLIIFIGLLGWALNV